MLVAILCTVAGCSWESSLDVHSVSGDYHELVYSEFTTTDIKSDIDSGKAYFILFLPSNHVSTPAVANQVEKSRRNELKDTGSSTLRAVVVRYQYAKSSASIKEFMSLLPEVDVPKDPYLILVIGENEVSRRWIVGNENIEAVANTLLPDELTIRHPEDHQTGRR